MGARTVRREKEAESEKLGGVAVGAPRGGTVRQRGVRVPDATEWSRKKRGKSGAWEVSGGGVSWCDFWGVEGTEPAHGPPRHTFQNWP